jgi:hypothetical protein
MMHAMPKDRITTPPATSVAEANAYHGHVSLPREPSLGVQAVLYTLLSDCDAI